MAIEIKICYQFFKTSRQIILNIGNDCKNATKLNVSLAYTSKFEMKMTRNLKMEYYVHLVDEF